MKSLREQTEEYEERLKNPVVEEEEPFKPKKNWIAIWIEVGAYLYVPVSLFLLLHFTAKPVDENDWMGTWRMVERPWWTWLILGIMPISAYLTSVFYTRRRNNNEINKRVLWKAFVNLIFWVINAYVIMYLRELIWD